MVRYYCTYWVEISKNFIQSTKISAKDSLSLEELRYTEKTLQGPRAVMWAKNARFAKKDAQVEKNRKPFYPSKTYLDSLQDLLSF